MNDPLGLFGEEEQTNADPLGLFGSEDTPQEKGFFAQQGENMLGLGAALGDMAGGLVKMPLGIGAGIGAKIRGGDGYNTDELRAAAQQEVERLIPSIGKSTGLDKNKTYELAMKPFELIGQGIDWAGNQAGEITGSKDVAGASKLGLDIATLGMGIPGAKLAGKGLARVAEAVDPGLRNAGKPKPRTNVDALLEEVKNPPPPVPEAPIVESRSGLELSKQAYEQALREKELQRQSAFNRPDELATLEAQTPMERMASDLGATEGLPKPPEAPSPMGNMARDLTEHSTPEARLAQDAIDLRQKAIEFEVAKQGGLDFNAAERARQEVAPLPPVDPLTVAVESHPAVKAATEKVASTEKTITVLEQKVASGEAKATQLIAALKQLEAAKAKAEKATTNVAGALAKTQPLNKGFGRKQRGAVDPRAFRVGFKGRLKSLSALTDKLHVDPVWQDRIRAALGGEFQRNQDGTPMIMLHGTRNEIKGKLRTTDEGFHAGLVGDATMFTQKANTKAGRGVAMGKHSYENGQLHPIVIKKGNYPYIPIDANLWEPQAILKGQTLAQQHIMNRIHEGLRKNNVPQPVVNQLLTLAENARGKDAANRTFSNLLKEAGIDGFFYRNTAESPKQLKLETLANRKGVEKRKEIISNSVDPESFVTWNPNNYTSLYSDKSVNPYNSDIVNMHSGIPFTREHWNKLREVGNAMIENAQQAIEFAKNVPDVDQTMVQRGINALTKGGSYLKAKVNSPVVHFAVDRLLAAEGAAKSAINEKIHGEYLTALRELSKQEFEDAYKILNQADQTQRAITPEAMTRHGISPKVQEAVIKHQELMADVLNQVNAARELAGKKPVTSRQGYSAMNMSGDFRKVVYKTINGVREVVGVISANSKTFGKNSLTKLEKLIGEKNPEYEFGPLQDLSTSRTITKGTPDAAFMDVLNTIGENNPNFAEFLKTLDEVHRDNPSNFLGMQQHAMQKKGVWGMEGRKQWLTGSENAKSFFENQVRYAESAYQWGEFSKAGLEISEVLHDPVVLKNHPNASKLAQEYLNNAMGLQTSRMGKAVDAAFDALFAPFGIGPSFPKQGIRVAKEVANTAMMSLSPTFLAIQLLQPVASLPGMVMYLRGKGMDSWAVAGSAKAMGTLYKISTGKPLNAIERGAVEYAKKNHVYATDMVQHSMDTQKGPLHYTRTITQAPQAHIETGTRASVFHTLVQTLHDGGLTPEKGLYEQAQRFTDLAMNNYSNMEKPMIYNALGPLGSMAYNLKSFAHNEISRWSMYAREIPNSGDAKPLLAQMATTIAFAGLMGLPFYSQWEQLYGFITKKLGEPRSLTLDTMKLSEDVGKHLGPKGAYALSHGMFATVGADISSRIGLGDVIPSSAADAAFAGGGKLVEMGKATGRAMINPSEENLKSAATNLAPPFLQGLAKDAWYTKGNLGYSIDPTNLKPTAELNDQDRLLGKLGILGINKSVQQTKNYELGQLDREFKGIRDKAMNTIAQDIFRDRAVLQKTIDKYFIDGQGDPKSFEAEVNALATKMNLSPNQLALLRDSASNSITRQRSLMRRVQ